MKTTINVIVFLRLFCKIEYKWVGFRALADVYCFLNYYQLIFWH